VYNVENLFDVDGVASYDEYQPSVYTPAHLRTKLQNTSEAVSRLTPSGQGPDIIFLQEIEVDQTPSPANKDLRALLAPDASRKVSEILSAPLDPAHASWPAEAWLLKALEDRGLTGYTAVVGSDGETRHEDGNPRSIKNVIFTRFPVLEVRQHPVENARNILEVLVKVDDRTLRLFSNHWKSGASDEKTERLRVQNARVLRARLDELLAQDPQADIVIGGDFNSQYNQKARYPKMQQTGMNDILRSQGNETALLTGAADLYNLWYELPNQARGSDTYRGEWGTLMQLLVTRGLYDGAGVQYVDNSFRVGRIAGLNETPDGTPLRWSNSGPAGSGFSDHFPIIAQFTTPDHPDRSRWLKLANPSDGQTPAAPVLVSVAVSDLAARARDASDASLKLRDGTHNGKLFLVNARVSSLKPLSVELNGDTWEIYAPDRALGDSLRSTWTSGSTVRFYGELGQFKGRWQFVLKDRSWLLSAQ
jgi:endonuclease/exonuclease/phosphatase family metal-dependent hydrolase